MWQINSLEEAQSLIGRYGSKQTLTNNYMLQEELSLYIQRGTLYAHQQSENLVFLVRKRCFYRMYFYLNALKTSFHFPNLDPVVQEILYRGGKYFPEKEVAYWEENGFRRHLGRDCFFARPNEVAGWKYLIPNESDIEIKSLEAEQHLKEAQYMIEAYLDAYTGDILSLAELAVCANRNELFGVFVEGQLAGILQSDFKNKTYWLGHMVVKEEFRGRKLSTILLNHYFQEGLKLDCRQFQLWVINDNTPALSLYRKYGFQYLNKSTISLLKSNNE